METTATTPSSSIIKMKNIKQNFGDTKVIDDISLSFDSIAINMLMGPSGCGKSTLMKMMGGVRPSNVPSPTIGTIHIDGKPCLGPHEDVVMVFQKYANRPDLSVRDNVGFPFLMKLWKNKVKPNVQKERIDHILESVGLHDKQKLLPMQLSGGQNQRVAIARALVIRPRILLMDEPFGALDPHTRQEMQVLLRRIWEEHQCLIVFVTHDIDEALTLGHRLIVLSRPPAQIALDTVISENNKEQIKRSIGKILQGSEAV